MSDDEDEQECSICRMPYNEDLEGGGSGYLGILEVHFCPTCLNGIYEMVREGDEEQ